MTELKLISKQSASIQPLVKNAIDSFVRSAEEGIQKTLLLDEYFQQIKTLIDYRSIIEESTLVYEARSRNRVG